MIKRIWFVTKAPGAAQDRFAAACRRAAEGSAGAPPDVRPLRVTLSSSRPDVTPHPRHDALGMEWFADKAHFERFSDWLGIDGDRWLGDTFDAAASPTIVAEELIGRGDDWLEARWGGGGPKLKHIAVARRAVGLSPAQFSDLWRSRAGTFTSQSGGPAVTIPDHARGLAYVQNHPLARRDGEWAYDAVNEVWFDDLDGLRRRIEWFADQMQAGSEDLVGDSWFIAACEEPVSVAAQDRTPR